MKYLIYLLLIIAACFLLLHLLLSKNGMKNPERPVPEAAESGSFLTVKDGTGIFVYESTAGPPSLLSPVSPGLTTIMKKTLSGN